MQKGSTGRSSSSTREDRSIGRPSDARRTHILKSRQSQADGSQIPRPRIRSSSSERASIRRSNLKTFAKTPLSVPSQRTLSVSSVTPKTPRVSSSRSQNDPQSANRGRSPSAERAGAYGAKTPRKDTRPINDKFYQTTMLQKIDYYFAAINQECLLNTNKSIRPITLKIFIETTGCLLTILDVKHEITTATYLVEIPKFAKKLHYPGVMTKSWLKTANTMHSWPHVLAWLSWLVEVCEVCEFAGAEFTVENLPFTDDGMGKDNNRKTLLCLLKCYAAWNEEKPEEENAFIEQHIEEMNNEHGDIEEQTAAALADLEKEKKGLELIEKQSTDIDEEIRGLEKIIEGLQQEDSNNVATVKSTEASAQRCAHKLQQLESDSEHMANEIKKNMQKQTELNALIANQSMSVNERDAIEKECSEIQNNIHLFDNHVADFEKELYAMDIKFAASNQNLYKAILAYNKDVIMLRYNNSCEAEADLVELKMPETNMLSDDFMELVRAKETAMLNMKEDIKQRISKMESQIETGSTELESLSDQLKTLREDNEQHAAKITEHKIFVQQIQHRAKETEIKLKEQIKKVESDIATLGDSMPDLESAAVELSEAKEKYEAVLRQQQFVEKSAERLFNILYSTLSQHRNVVSELMKKLPHS